MGKMTKEQAEQLAELERLRDAPDEDDDDDQGDDDGGVILLRGRRADTFLESLLGPSKPRKSAPAGKAKDKPADDDAPDDDDADAEKQEEQKPPQGHRYFRS